MYYIIVFPLVNNFLSTKNDNLEKKKKKKTQLVGSINKSLDIKYFLEYVNFYKILKSYKY